MGNIDLDEIALAISLDGLARSPISPKSALHMHVSKPPKEGQAAYEFLKVTLSQSDVHICTTCVTNRSV